MNTVGHAWQNLRTARRASPRPRTRAACSLRVLHVPGARNARSTICRTTKPATPDATAPRDAHDPPRARRSEPCARERTQPNPHTAAKQGASQSPTTQRLVLTRLRAVCIVKLSTPTLTPRHGNATSVVVPRRVGADLIHRRTQQIPPNPSSVDNGRVVS